MGIYWSVSLFHFWSLFYFHIQNLSRALHWAFSQPCLKPLQQAPGRIFSSCWPPTGRNAACFFLCLCCSGYIRSRYKPPTTVPFAWRSFWRAGATVDSLWSLLRRCVLGERRYEITFRWMHGLIRPVVSMHSSFLTAPTLFVRAVLGVKCPYMSISRFSKSHLFSSRVNGGLWKVTTPALKSGSYLLLRSTSLS